MHNTAKLTDWINHETKRKCDYVMITQHISTTILADMELKEQLKAKLCH